MTTAAIFLGFNIEGEPMPTDQRSRFIDDVERSLALNHAEIISTGPTTGQWEGQEELGFMFLISAPGADIPAIALTLAYHARQYRQDAIGFLVHDHKAHRNSYVKGA